MDSRKLRIGFIGAGANTRKMHLPGFQKCENVELSMVANRSLESAEAVAKQTGIQRAVENWRDVIEEPSIDAVCIGTWPNMHAEVTIAALEQGKHVLCEARMACNLDEARRMKAAADVRPELVAQVVPAPFSLDYDSNIRQMIHSGELGEILEVRVVHTSGLSADPEAPMTWRQDKSLSGNNVMTMGILHETVQRWMQDEPEWLLADAMVSQETRAYVKDATKYKVEVPDSLSILGRFQQTGARLVYHFSGVESGEPRTELFINGSKGALRFDVLNTTLLFSKAGSEEAQEVAASPEANGWQVEADFVRSIREGAPIELTSFEQGVRYMTFTEMVADSMNKGSDKVFWRDY